MKSDKHLPLFGVGPFYGVVVIALTILGILLSCFGLLDSGLIKIKWLKIIFIIIGILFIIEGFFVWAKAALGKKNIDYYIKNNILYMDGIYSICRNPCYSGIALMCTGALFIANNLWLLILPFVYWIFMTLLMKCSEEKWLKEKYGEEYIDYCSRVNRCIPWFSKRK